MSAGVPVTVGLDEAGRGPLLGPLVVCACALSQDQARLLQQAGVADSKRFGATAAGRRRRAELAAEIRSRAACCLARVIPADEVDAWVRAAGLDALERHCAIELLERLDATPGLEVARIVCDGARLFGSLAARWPRLEARDRGESVHVAVAAASVVAKDLRDRALEAIAARYAPSFGPLAGGGYPNAATRRFVQAYVERFGRPPPELRRTWGAGRR